MDQQEALTTYLLRRADDVLILGHRLSEWCGHGPVLEEDIALTNRALDHIGEARNLFQYAGVVEGKERSEDDLAYLRNERQYLNAKLVEQPNGDYAHTIVRSFFFDAYHLPMAEALLKSVDPHLVGIAAKTVKEAAYHLRHSSEWLIRFGDGTEESHRRAQAAVDALWTFTGEFFATDAVDEVLIKAGIAPDPAAIRSTWEMVVDRVLGEAGLECPAPMHMASGGRTGHHTEHLGHLLSEMQYLQRTHPGASW